jgi:DNA (cytosine-5)-methyltransferase 1
MLSLVSIFSGGGGLDLGLEAAGFETLFASDVDEHSCNSLRNNKGVAKKMGKPFLQQAQIVEKDIKELSAEEILFTTGLKAGELDLLAGGPPCQAFSVFGKRKGREDPRGRLVDDYLRLLTGLRPKAFVFENVYGLLTVQGGEIFREITRQLSEPSDDLSYRLSVHRCNASNYGVPQFRDRIFIIGSREGRVVDTPTEICKNPLSSANLLPWRTVENGLFKLPKIGKGIFHNHIGRKHSPRIVERYSKMSFGERDHHTRINRLNPSRPSYAIIVGSDAGGGKGHVHPHEAREVTPRESARMQCFPDWWWFSGTSRHPIRQVGNAVPSLLGYAVGRQIIEDLFDLNANGYREAIELLDQEHLFDSKELEFLEDFDFSDQPNLLALAT